MKFPFFEAYVWLTRKLFFIISRKFQSRHGNISNVHIYNLNYVSADLVTSAVVVVAILDNGTITENYIYYFV